MTATSIIPPPAVFEELSYDVAPRDRGTPSPPVLEREDPVVDKVTVEMLWDVLQRIQANNASGELEEGELPDQAGEDDALYEEDGPPVLVREIPMQQPAPHGSRA